MHTDAPETPPAPEPPAAPPATGGETVLLFRRALALVHLFAFGSLWLQVQGLIGPEGIRPAAATLSRAAAVLAEREESALWAMPTLGWFTGGGALALHGLCGAGVALALALLLWPRLAVPALAGLFGLYLSLFHLGAEFLRYQWDLLLLEVTFAALFYTARFPLSIWLPRLVLFKLMLSSGVVKLASGDPTWHGLTALDYHYWTQPIPHIGGLVAWHLPGHALSCLAMFAVELIVPWFVFIRPAWAFFPFLGLLGVMGATGNYGFFHVLSAALCIPLLTDETWRRWLGGRLPLRGRPGPLTPLRRPVRIALAVPIVWLMTLSVLHLGMLGQRGDPSASLLNAYRALVGPFDAWQFENGYGLFARMTTHRDEIHVEGSNDDGATWRRYLFRYKPDDAHDLPPPTLFHMPRLDWQMWFAALGTCRRNEWFLAFQRRLLEGSPSVTALLAHNPFPDGPPGRLRTRTERFTFAASSADGVWTIAPGAPYCPELTLASFASPPGR